MWPSVNEMDCSQSTLFVFILSLENFFILLFLLVGQQIIKTPSKLKASDMLSLGPSDKSLFSASAVPVCRKLKGIKSRDKRERENTAELRSALHAVRAQCRKKTKFRFSKNVKFCNTKVNKIMFCHNCKETEGEVRAIQY